MVELRLRDYLQPGGKYPYNKLFEDMEAALAAGNRVVVISVPGFVMASGNPGYLRPWNDNERTYKSAKDCVNKRNGKKID